MFQSFKNSFRTFPQIHSQSGEQEIAQGLDVLSQLSPSQLMKQQDALTCFLILALHFCQDPQLKQLIKEEIHKTLLSLRPLASSPPLQRSVAALERCERQLCLCSSVEPTQKEWDTHALGSPQSVRDLLIQLSSMFASQKLCCSQMKHLPQSIQTALQDEESWPSFCKEAAHNPALKGQLIDLYRGCQQLIAA